MSAAQQAGLARTPRTRARWLWDGAWALTGNLAKIRVLEDLIEEFPAGRASRARILDVGCAGPSPLNLWEPFLACPEAPPIEVQGVDVDAAGVEAVRRLARERGWTQVARLEVGSAYDLPRLFAPGTFDAVVSTQVLEHLARPDEFLRGAAEVTRPGGVCYVTFDSGHFPSHDAAWKRLARRVLVALGKERYHERGLTETEVVGMAGSCGLSTVETRFYNLHVVKRIHNHGVSADRKNRLAEAWMELEDFLNDDRAFIEKGRHWFAGIYMKLKKESRP